MSRRRYGPWVVETSNEDKVLFPDNGITKGELIDYYARIADHMLPWVRDRPSMLQRFPDGIEASGFYQKQASAHLPGWVTTTTVVKADGGHQDLVVCDKRATLAQLANLGCVTFHPWLSRSDRLDHPDQLVIDLDPSGDDFAPVRAAARACRELLDELDLPAWLKTTGSRGLHVVVPLDRSADFDETRSFARDAMDLLASRLPGELTTEIRKSKRRGRLFLDVARNAYAQTVVAPFSVRALPGAPVATPIDWDELGHVTPRRFHVRNLFRRLGQREDPWQGMTRHAHAIAPARRRLDRLREREGTGPV